MQNYSAESYGESMAPVFDIINDDPEELDRIVGFLTDYVGEGPVLDPGIGTGRIAIPIARSGVEVYGTDISPAMIAQLRSKEGAEKIVAEVQDMRKVDFGRRFSLIFIVGGSLGALLSAEEQREFLAHARELITDDGHLVIETLEIDESRFTHDQHVTTSMLDVGYVVLSAGMRDPENQILSCQNVLITQDGIQLFPIKIRYHDAAELDAMTGDSGFVLRERYGDWTRTPYEPGAEKHISVYSPRL